MEDDTVRIVERTDLVFQAIKVDAGFAAHTGVDHSEQCCRNIDEVDAPLVGRGCETAQVGHHSAAHVDEQGVAGGVSGFYLLPHFH